MLYIFQVDTGQMICFEMDVAISTVSSLKQKISSNQGIPIDKQVLLVSGGEILEQNSRVCNYAAGTDTNPIFLFNKLNIEGGGGIVTEHSTNEQGNNVNVTDLETLQRQIENTNGLPLNYMSVVTRAQLAQHVYEMGKEITRKCEVLIHHQHLQHQGWAAVVANLDDIVNVFNSKLNSFVNSYEKFTTECSSDFVDSYVNSLDMTLKTLDTIKVPNGSVPKSIVSWLSEHYGAHDCLNPTPLHSHLQSTASSTRKTYDRLTQNNFLQSLQQETTSVIEKASSLNMKEIKGLEERLWGLDQLLQEANKLVLDQHELTQAFHQNVSRASDLRDSSIFPDLSASHQHQLAVMYNNHKQLEDIRRRCAKAKEELTVNLNTRLKWIAFVQKNLSEQSGKISLYNESLKRLRVNVNILQQIQSCESMFKVYCDEVNRRAKTSRKLRNLSLRITEFNNLAERENEKRSEFIDLHAGHFLSQLFDHVIEDNRVCKLPVPELLEYNAYGEIEESDADEEEEPGQCANLRARIRELESALNSSNTHAREFETIANERQSAIERQSSDYLKLTTEVEEMRTSLMCRSSQVEKLTKQVNDLKHLLDEFREKEEEQIETRNREVAEHHSQIDELKEKCEERVVELTRMFEFDTAQKIKAVKDEQKHEFDALIKRFKLMNKSNAVGGSSEISSPKCNKVEVESKREVFSDEEESGADNSICEDTRGGSLERAVDAAAEILDATTLDASFVVQEHVISTATRLHKLSRVSISTCRVGGEANLFYWNSRFNAFTVYLNNRSLNNVHFLNTSNEDTKTLSESQMFIANVTDKEFCVARRPQNRYNVPQGFHFYRVKCKVIEVIEDNHANCM